MRRKDIARPHEARGEPFLAPQCRRPFDGLGVDLNRAARVQRHYRGPSYLGRTVNEGDSLDSSAWPFLLRAAMRTLVAITLTACCLALGGCSRLPWCSCPEPASLPPQQYGGTTPPHMIRYPDRTHMRGDTGTHTAIVHATLMRVHIARAVNAPRIINGKRPGVSLK